MNRKMPRIANLVDTFGSFAEPFLNMALDNEEIGYAWRKYFAALKLNWKNEFPHALKEVNDGLKSHSKDKTLYYLLLSRKLSILIGMGDPKGDMIYSTLLRDEAKIPFPARRYVMPILLNYLSIREIEGGIKGLKKVRIWSKKYDTDRRTQIFLLLGNARDKIKNGKLSKAFSLFLQSFRIAAKIPHPLGITDALNDMAWYMRNRHPLWSRKIAKQAVYWAGWYRENVASVFYTFDTLFECQQKAKDPLLYENAEIMLLTNKYLPHGVGRETQEHYREKIEFCKQIVPTFETSEYKNSEFLRKYLKKHMISISHTHKISGVGKTTILGMLKGYVKEIKGDTLKKLIKALKLIPSPTDSPFPIWNEFLKLKMNDTFSKSIEKLKRTRKEQRQIDFISTYMAYVNRRRSLPYLSKTGKLKIAFDFLEDADKFKTFMSERYETMEFVNNMFNEMHPFFQARKDLVVRFMKKIPKSAKKKFMEVYTEITASRPFISERDRKMIDRFVMDYSRYNIKWGIGLTFMSPFKYESSRLMSLKRIIQCFRLRKIPAFLAYYALEDEKDRKRLLKMLEKFII